MDQRVTALPERTSCSGGLEDKRKERGGGGGGGDTFLKLNIKTDVKNPNCIDKRCKIPVCSALFLSQLCVQPEFIYMRHLM